VWIHRGAALFFVALAIPACLWWKQSILFVILLSLATQVSTEISAAEAADDRTVLDRLDRIEALIEQRGDADGRTPGILS
jgi:membrane protein implicated in regulation of membrane protease activity